MSRLLQYPVFLLLSVVATSCRSVPNSVSHPSFEKRYGGYVYCALPSVRQSGDKACGAAATESVLKYWGKEASQEFLVSRYPLSQSGYSMAEMKQMCIDQGMTTFLLSLGTATDEMGAPLAPTAFLRQQLKKGRPMIIAVRRSAFERLRSKCPPAYYLLAGFVGSGLPLKEHFVVIFGFRDDRFLVMDPNFGLYDIQRERLIGQWRPMKYAALLCCAPGSATNLGKEKGSTVSH